LIEPQKTLNLLEGREFSFQANPVITTIEGRPFSFQANAVITTIEGRQFSFQAQAVFWPRPGIIGIFLPRSSFE
jgi:uncharacterized protein YqgV (UPF0045/DUF77 family)